MRRAVALLMVLLLTVLHTPSSAQALMTDFLPFGTSEPAMLFLTGLALLSISRIGSRR